MKKALVFAILLLLLLPLLSACTEEMPAPPESGYSVSGIVLLDGGPLAGVLVWSGGEVVGSTDENGVYSVSGLEKYSSVAFEKEGYSFSPASYTVTGDANDYNVVASVVSPPPEDEPDDPSEPDGPDVPDLPDLPDEPDEPDAPDAEPLSAPSSFFAAYSSSGAFTVGFSADVDTETLSVTAENDNAALSATAGINDEVLLFDGISVPFDATVTEDRLEVTMDVTALAERLAGEFSLVVTVSAEGMESAVSEPFMCSFVLAPPRIDGLTVADGILSWTAHDMPAGCTFAVLANGVKVAETSASSIALADTALPVPEGASLSVAALVDGIPVAFSDLLDL